MQRREEGRKEETALSTAEWRWVTPTALRSDDIDVATGSRQGGKEAHSQARQAKRRGCGAGAWKSQSGRRRKGEKLVAKRRAACERRHSHCQQQRSKHIYRYIQMSILKYTELRERWRQSKRFAREVCRFRGRENDIRHRSVATVLPRRVPSRRASYCSSRCLFVVSLLSFSLAFSLLLFFFSLRLPPERESLPAAIPSF